MTVVSLQSNDTPELVSGSASLMNVTCDVSVSAVRVMVKALRAEIDLPVPTAMIPQLHLPGKRPDVDFGDVLVYVNGEKIKAKMFAMRLSHSGKAFHMVYSGESRRVLF